MVDITLNELARDKSFEGFRNCAFDLEKAFYSNRREDSVYKKKVEQTLSEFQIVPVDMLFIGFDRKVLKNFILQIDMAQKCFKRLVDQKAFDRTFLWIFRYEAGIKKKLDTHFKKLSVMLTAAKAALPGDQRFIQTTDRPIILEKQKQPLLEKIIQFFRCDDSEARNVEILIQNNTGIFKGKEASFFNKTKGKEVSFFDKTKRIAAKLKCSPSEALSIVVYIEKNRKRLGQTDREPLLRETTGLVRTIQFDRNGKVWIYQNRANQDDKIFGAGEFKRVTGAIDYDQVGEKFARPVGKGKSKDGKDIRAVSDNELHFLSLFGDHTEGVVETISTRIYKGKSGTKWSAIQKYYETDLHSELMRNTLSHEERMKIARDLCVGMSNIHERQVVHRDIKPPNILFTRSKGMVKAVFADFGLACYNNQIHSWAGSPFYSAPEYLNAANYSGITNKVDIYSLGKTLEALFMGQKKSKEMTKLIGEMLDKDPTKRPTAQEALNRVANIA